MGAIAVGLGRRDPASLCCVTGDFRQQIGVPVEKTEQIGYGGQTLLCLMALIVVVAHADFLPVNPIEDRCQAVQLHKSATPCLISQCMSSG